MPTLEEIKNICTEYVDELFAFDDMSEQENIEAKNDAFVMCMAFAGHILEKHCIVPKSRARELQQIVIDNQCSVDYNLIDGLLDWIEFNLGKSLFNEKKG